MRGNRRRSRAHTAETFQGGRLAVWPAACLLACSWTWAIATLYPILLIRDYGVAGWLSFALPNVVGAAAVGFLSRRQLRWIQLHHWRAVRAFSAVTVAFHAFVLLWIGLQFSRPLAVLLMVGTITIALVSLPSLRAWSFVAVVLTALGLLIIGAVVFFASHPEQGWLKPLVSVTQPRLPGRQALLALGVANAAGFLCCPFLDRSFLTIRRSMSSDLARSAFPLAFGLFFLVYLIFALLYSQRLLELFPIGAPPDKKPEVFEAGILLFIVLQSLFTLALHMALAYRDSVKRRIALLQMACFTLFGLLLATLTVELPGAFEKSSGEVTFRVFLVLYGAVFPAYVLLRFLPKALRWQVTYSPRLESLIFMGCAALALPGALIYFVADQPLILAAALAPIAAGFLLLVARRIKRPRTA